MFIQRALCTIGQYQPLLLCPRPKESGLGMRIFVAITDQDWFNLHASSVQVDEVNFWRPSPTANFKALQPGELMLFKLHSPLNFIAGGGFFTRFLHLPLSLAWESFGRANGVVSVEEMRMRIGKYRHLDFASTDNPNVGCIAC